MKRLVIIFLVGILSISAFSQNSMLSTLYRNYAVYQNYVVNGSAVRAQNSQKILTRGISLYLQYMGASLEGRSGLQDSVLTAFDALYGKTHSPPTFELTAVSYLDLDSLLIDGEKIENFYPRDSIDAWIEAAGIDSTVVNNLILTGSIDSTFLNAHLVTFRDSLTHNAAMKDSVLTWISDSSFSASEIYVMILDTAVSYDTLPDILTDFYDTLSFMLPAAISELVEDSLDAFTVSSTSTDSSLWQVDAGVIYFDTDISSVGTHRITLENDQLELEDESSGNIINFDATTGYVYGSSPLSNYLELRFHTAPTSTSPVIIPYRADPNTGFTRAGTDKAGIVGGGVSTLTSEYNSGLGVSITKVTDSLYVSGGISAERIEADSIKTANGYHTNLLSFDSASSDSSVAVITPSGGTILGDLERFGGDYSSATQPNIPTGEFGFWYDTDDSKVYLIKDVGGTQYLIELTE